MPKRSRYGYVTIVADYVQIYANGNEYTLPSISSWTTFEVHSTVNQEEPVHFLSVNAPDGNFVIRCRDEDETNSIIGELIEQGF